MEKKGIAHLRKEAEKSKKNYAHYFQPIDKGSSMPTWYNPAFVMEENTWLTRAKRELDQNLVPQDEILQLKAQIRMREKKVKDILASQMKTEEMIKKNKDAAYNRYKELGDTIADSMFTRDEMFYVDGKHGMRARKISPRDEADREHYRKHLVKEWKIIGKALGEDTNIEGLRKGR